ncbi:2-hydroxyacid dehydrogenase [Capnocytophaga catalasegens]|uniref:2-hydroxyacid dehydrogenase n=1 Tax=Capnocytophaga catalasegens TaxID=1004260 RepID=A0AAV5AS20_9FLAO|nr:2-hydroxyacid dehydrogenase [Capnocytophaga catalasegens]GIZ15694.1 2-hydroxyacid dehydrogenase [Capnocytophaga catalasegens]GJM50081.1 2-hydroxyacid dehydrogenase [Capnocytophaga catalasegens]GJM53094.1 2-hydroxyacid dehydrogenase [Capnocytophaga catalasegens]
MKILHIDTNHPLMIEQLSKAGFENHEDYTSSKKEILKKIALYDGLIIRSRFSIDKAFLDEAHNLKFIGRVGAGLENIDCQYAQSKGVMLISAPEGNRNAVGEHTLALLLSLLNKIKKADTEVQRGIWLREENRGYELDYLTVGIIGYGNMGKSFAKKLRGFSCKVICYDIKPDVGDENAIQVSLKQLQEQADVVSLHTPQTPLTVQMVNHLFISQFSKNFWFLNTARGKSVVTTDLVQALKSGKIKGAGLDVLEYEKSSFEDFFQEELPEDFSYLLNANNVIITPHIAGWTIESKTKLAQVIVDKIIQNFVS